MITRQLNYSLVLLCSLAPTALLAGASAMPIERLSNKATFQLPGMVGACKEDVYVLYKELREKKQLLRDLREKQALDGLLKVPTVDRKSVV